LLRTLLPRLQHVEHVDRVIIESRGGSDKIAGSYIGAVSDAGAELWKIVSELHLIE
jgi:hypothetical protein